MQAVMLKCAVIWSAFIPVAIVNGFVREKCLAPLVGVRRALPLSGISCAALFFLLVWVSIPWLGTLPAGHFLLMGCMWLIMTVVFEFIVGRQVAHKSWEELLRAYDITTGNLWPVVLLAIAAAPWLVARLRGLAI